MVWARSNNAGGKTQPKGMQVASFLGTQKVDKLTCSVCRVCMCATTAVRNTRHLRHAFTPPRQKTRTVGLLRARAYNFREIVDGLIPRTQVADVSMSHVSRRPHKRHRKQVGDHQTRA